MENYWQYAAYTPSSNVLSGIAFIVNDAAEGNQFHWLIAKAGTFYHIMSTVWWMKFINVILDVHTRQAGDFIFLINNAAQHTTHATRRSHMSVPSHSSRGVG